MHESAPEPRPSAYPPSDDLGSSLPRENVLQAWSDTDARVALGKYEVLLRNEARRLRSLALRTNTLDEEDLCAEGRIAVLEALKRFQGWGVNEVTWVRMRVRQRMLDAIRRSSLWSRLDSRVVARDRRGETLTEGEKVRAEDAHQRKLVSLDAEPVGNQVSLAETIPDSTEETPENILEDKRKGAELASAIVRLPERTRKIVAAVLLEGRLARDVASEFCISESRISQILHGAVPMLRAHMRGESFSAPRDATKAET